MSKPLLSMIIPCHNEERAVAPVLERVMMLKHLPDFEKDFSGLELIVVDDGSCDHSLHELQRHSDVKILSHDVCRGYGAALKTGFASATGEILCFLDMDASYDPLNVIELWHAMKTTQADVVYGNRLHNRQGMPRTRRFGNLFFSQLTKKIGQRAVTDVATGFRLFKRLALPYFDAPEDGLNYSLALTLRLTRSPLKISETPIRYLERVGASKLNIVSDGFKFLFVAGRNIKSQDNSRIDGSMRGP